MPTQTTDRTVQDYALRRMREAMAEDDMREAAFWLGVLVPGGEMPPGNAKLH